MQRFRRLTAVSSCGITPHVWLKRFKRGFNMVQSSFVFGAKVLSC